MPIKICHASIDENGKISGGAAGDQTGREVCCRLWYSKPWNYYIECLDEALGNQAANLFLEICSSNLCGYDQSNRISLYDALIANGKKVSGMKKCETDCSAAVATIYNILGLSIHPSCTTRNIRSALLATGKFKAYSDSAHIFADRYAKRGGLYLREGSHIVMAVENGSAYSPSRQPHNPSDSKPQAPAASSKLTLSSSVASVQNWLNKYYHAALSEDGLYGKKTKAALIKAWQTEAGGLSVDGCFGPASKKAASSHIIKKGSTGVLVTIWQSCLVCRGYNPNGIDGTFGSGCRAATVSFQKASHLVQDGCVGPNTWYQALH